MSETVSRVSLDSSATELVDALAARRISAVELTEAAIDRIVARDPAINAVVVRDFDRAREQAKAADAALGRGERRPLLGLPMTVKESHDVAGLPTTWGVLEARDRIAQADALGVQRLKAAGAVILGKTNVPVMLADIQTENPIYGRTNNPWDVTRGPGGSSGGGAAAVAARMVPLEFGSDIGGSIRNPAHFCGVYGHKPSWNLVPTRGHAPPSAPRDGTGRLLSVIGPLARTAADLERALQVLAGPDDLEGVGYQLALPAARHGRLADFRVLVVDEHPVTRTDAVIRAGLEDLARRLERLGASVARETPSLPDLAAEFRAYRAMLKVVSTRGKPGVETVSAHEWLGMLDDQQAARRGWAALFNAFDVVLTPVIGVAAFPPTTEAPETRTIDVDGRSTPYFDQVGWAGMATYANLPATAAPLGRNREGLPFGVQIIGPYLEDLTPIRFAGLLEREFGGFTPPPGC